ncbi:MAG: tRNA (adenosine(37)-N6)-dimethylallyltransferase MiaA [Armatimonadota bacterium]
MGKLQAIAVVGPTSSGKTALSVRLAELLHGEVLSADCMAAYKGFDIGTAKPAPDELARAQFHLLDVVEPEEPFNVALFQKLALEAVRLVQQRGHLPIIAGGTGLYLRALLHGFSLPPAAGNAEMRQKLLQRAADGETEQMHLELQQLDADAAAKIHPNDVIRLTRALEVILTTGQPFSQLQKAEAPEELRHVAVLGLTMPRELLAERIELRCRLMLEAGWLDEVRRLLDAGVPVSSPAMRSLGYRELAAVVMGEMSLEEAVPEITKQTRQYAKRQMTWFRKEPGVQWLDATQPLENLLNEVMTHIHTIDRETAR